MYRYHNSYVGGDMATLAAFLVLLLVWALVRLVAFVIRTLIKHSKNTALRVAGAVCAILCAVGCLLAGLVSVGFLVLPIGGLVGFLITCLVVDLRGSQTLLPVKTNLINSVLSSNWWGQDTPLQPGKAQQLAA
jgi:hypothetical protein